MNFKYSLYYFERHPTISLEDKKKYLLLSAEYSTTELPISVRPATAVDTSWQLICGKWSDQLNTVCVGRGEEGGVFKSQAK
jgi:hypothetical protein